MGLAEKADLIGAIRALGVVLTATVAKQQDRLATRVATPSSCRPRSGEQAPAKVVAQPRFEADSSQTGHADPIPHRVARPQPIETHAPTHQRDACQHSTLLWARRPWWGPARCATWHQRARPHREPSAGSTVSLKEGPSGHLAHRGVGAGAIGTAQQGGGPATDLPPPATPGAHRSVDGRSVRSADVRRDSAGH